ncbi:phosphopantetheine-binding protein [Actinomadura sp. 6N118]|uniref:phosphopantetheine-binding protein n=1 Tax=Actinomadura sp. 6N118 TaxID=3375151 RepID=UPI003794F20F
MTDTIATAQATLCQIIADVVDRELVGPRDGFFEVGGDSVLAVQVVARAREAGLVLSVRDLFDHQTPESLAAVIGDLAAAGTAATAAGTGGTGGDSAESPLMTFADDEFGDFEELGAGRPDGGDEGEGEGEWEIIT